jgi:hypothetical protein
LSATTVTRPTSQWQDEARAFGDRDLSGTDYVYLWVDGIHLKVRLEQEKLCLKVMIGVRADGRKELVALADGTASRLSRGPICCFRVADGAWPRRCWPWATGRSASGRRCARRSRHPGAALLVP